jgi:hypothetical protein
LFVVMFAGSTSAQVEWTQRASAIVISNAGSVPAVTDFARGRAVLFGGSLYLWDGIWDWNGIAWVQSAPATWPSPRNQLAASTDVGGAGVLVFGGSGFGVSSDTWHFDGVNWMQRTPAHSPPAGLSTMSYDAARNRVVLFHSNGSTWLWDGQDWTQATPANNPPSRFRTAMTFDPTRGRLVLFSGSQMVADTWEWDGTNWQQASPSVSPPARADAGLAFDPVRQRVLLHGGRDPISQALDDTWEWDGTTWTQLVAPGPTNYTRATLVHDPVRGRLLLTRSGPDDTWEWTGSAWVRLGAFVGPAEDAYGRSLAYDTQNEMTLCFGGRRNLGGYIADDTWSWNGTAWSLLTPSNRPPPRAWSTLVPTTPGGSMFLFGGEDGQRRGMGDTWAWTGSNWQSLQPSLSLGPSPRYGHSAAYDPRRNRVVLFGGTDGTLFLGDTWEWDGAAWTLHTPSTSPVARRGAYMAWHGGRGRVILFGGGDLASLYLNDTWEWDGTNWIPVTTASSPAPRRSGHMTYDAARDRCVLFGGQTTASIRLADVWEFDGVDWLPRATTQSPTPRIYAPLAYDARRRQVVLFGGSHGSHGLADTWTLEPQFPASFTAYGSGCPGSNGVPQLAATPGQLPWLGTTLGLTVTPVPGAFFVFLGASRTSWLGLPLPLDLGFPGLPGCALAASPDVTLAGVGNGGVGQLALQIPARPEFLGAVLFTQALLPDAAVVAVVSNGGEFRLGGR